jgi:hypothetical protein
MAYTILFVTDRLKIGYIDLAPARVLDTNIVQDHMERFWSNSIFKYLRVEPEDHYFLLTEPVCPEAVQGSEVTLTQVTSP